jgi:4-hydroxy-tetrahydrodipicolinate synthase
MLNEKVEMLLSKSARTWAQRCGRTTAYFSTSSKIPDTNIYQGVYPILVTPFHDDKAETIDFGSFRRSIAFMKEAGVTGVTVAGVLGESNRMTDFERQQLVETAAASIRDLNNHEDEKSPSPPALLKLCVGATHTGTSATVALCEMASELGADGVMIAPTKEGHGNQPADDDILELYMRVSDACPDLSIILQDLPSQTGVYLSADLLIRIATNVPGVHSIKLESLPTVNRLASLQASSEFRSSGCTILTGLGALYAGFDLEQGTSGFMTGFAFPEILLELHRLAQTGDFDGAHALYAKYLPLIVLEQQPAGGGLGIRKKIYKRRGLIASAVVRHPGKSISPTLRDIVIQQLSRSFPGLDITRPLPQEVFQL